MIRTTVTQYPAGLRDFEISNIPSLLQKCQGGGPGLPHMGSVGATAPTYSTANFFKMTFARGSTVLGFVLSGPQTWQRKRVAGSGNL